MNIGITINTTRVHGSVLMLQLYPLRGHEKFGDFRPDRGLQNVALDLRIAVMATEPRSRFPESIEYSGSFDIVHRFELRRADFKQAIRLFHRAYHP